MQSTNQFHRPQHRPTGQRVCYLQWMSRADVCTDSSIQNAGVMRPRTTAVSRSMTIIRVRRVWYCCQQTRLLRVAACRLSGGALSGLVVCAILENESSHPLFFLWYLVFRYTYLYICIRYCTAAVSRRRDWARKGSQTFEMRVSLTQHTQRARWGCRNMYYRSMKQHTDSSYIYMIQKTIQQGTQHPKKSKYCCR